jgi:hypothetical protein
VIEAVSDRASFGRGCFRCLAGGGETNVLAVAWNKVTNNILVLAVLFGLAKRACGDVELRSLPDLDHGLVFVFCR